MSKSTKQLKQPQDFTTTFLSASYIYQRSPTFHKQIKQIRFPKGERFSPNKKKDELILNFPSQLSQNGTNQGFGKKYMYPQFFFPNAEYVPAPDKYKLKRYFDEKSDAGKTFGESFKKYENTYCKNSLGRTIKYDATQTPGPGRYHIQKSIGHNKKKISLANHFKDRDLNYFKQAPNQYKVQHNQTESSIGKPFTFGSGRKLDIIEITQNIKEQFNPGPGKYETNDTSFKNKSFNHKLNPQLRKGSAK